MSTACHGVNCYNDSANRTKDFTEITDWAKMNNEKRTSAVASRCRWAKCCGRKVGDSKTRNVWLGVDEYCQ